MTEERAVTADFAPPPELGRWQTRSLAAGAAVIALAAVVAFLTANARGFFFSYLVAYVFWTGVAAGCLALAMLQFVARGAWGVAIRRVVESGARTLPLMALLFLPIAAGMGELFPWSHTGAASDEALRLKQAYLNKPFFIARAAGCFAVWLALAYFINRWSGEQDRTGANRLTDYMRNLSGPGIVLFGLTVTLASTDWVMSLDPHWASSIFGILFMGGWGLSALTFVVVLLSLLGRYEPLRSALTPKHFHDLGTLMFALVMLYTYFAFSQFLIIWSGNLPEEIPWYLRRMTGGWQFVGMALFVFHFAAPFLLLMSRKIKRRVRALGLIACALLVMRVVDTFYLVAPEGTRAHGAGASHVGHFPGPVETLLYVALPVGMGGVWLAFFIRQLRRRPLLPPNDPLIDRALRHGREEDHLF
jgi:hypothetical protein